MMRWATLAALFGVLIAGVTYDRIDLAPEPDPLPLAPRVVTPAVAAATPLSNVWFCPVGSGAADGYAPHQLTITNAGTGPAVATIDLMTEAGPGNSVVIEIAQNATEVFDVAALDTGPAVGAVVEVVGGQGIVGHRITTEFGETEGPCSSSTSDTWYFADGATTRDAFYVIALLNPFPQDVVFSMSFQTTTRRREPDDLKAAVVPGRSVRLIDVGQFVAREPHVATVIETVQGQLAVERLQRFNGELGPVGAAVQLGVPDPASEWAFPAGRVHAGGDHRLVVYNPGEAVAQFDVEFDLDPADRASYGLVPIEASVQPGRLVVLDLVEIMEGFGLPLPVDVGLRVRAANEVPVLAERWQATPPIDTSLIGAGGDQARVFIPGVRFRQTDTDPLEVPEEEFAPTASLFDLQATADRGVATSRGTEVAAERWVFPYLSLASADGQALDPAATVLVVAGEPGTEVLAQLLLAGELVGLTQGIIGDSGLTVLALPAPATGAAVLLQASAPVIAEGQVVLPGRRLSVVPGVPVLDAATIDEVTRPDAVLGEVELPVTTTTIPAPTTQPETTDPSTTGSVTTGPAATEPATTEPSESGSTEEDSG